MNQPLTLNGISIGLPVFAQLTRVPHTQRPRYMRHL